jgi:hypothetical protein
MRLAPNSFDHNNIADEAFLDADGDDAAADHLGWRRGRGFTVAIG